MSFIIFMSNEDKDMIPGILLDLVEIIDAEPSAITGVPTVSLRRAVEGIRLMHRIYDSVSKHTKRGKDSYMPLRSDLEIYAEELDERYSKKGSDSFRKKMCTCKNLKTEAHRWAYYIAEEIQEIARKTGIVSDARIYLSRLREKVLAN